jgi:hypothetical protein
MKKTSACSGNAKKHCGAVCVGGTLCPISSFTISSVTTNGTVKVVATLGREVTKQPIVDF